MSLHVSRVLESQTKTSKIDAETTGEQSDGG